jgi:hypothetical protein
MFGAPNVRAYATALCRVRERRGGFLWFGGETRTVYLGTENEYTPIGTSARAGATFFDPATASVGRVEALDDASTAYRLDESALFVRENGSVDFDISRTIWGPGVGAFRKQYAEMLPEDRARHFQSLLGGVAQAASATRELVTETASYPARRTFSCHVPAYATVTDDAMTLVLPAFETSLFPLTGTLRETPLGVGACERARTVLTVTFPAGWDVVEHLPAPYVFSNPCAADETWTVFTVATARDAEGRLTVTVARERPARGACVLPPTYFALLKDWNRIGAAKANRTITVRRRKAK